MVGVEVLAAFTKPLPETAHIVLVAFWGFAVQRGTSRRNASAAIEARLDALAERYNLPKEYLRDEFSVFQTSLKLQLPQGADHDDQ